jgi:hypothetical protein
MPGASQATKVSPDIHNELKRDVERLVGVRLSSVVDLPTNGLTNRVFAAYSASGALVIRVAPPDEVTTYEKEREYASYAASLGVRTPRVFGTAVSADWALHVSEYIPGTDLNHVEPGDSIDPWRQVGEMIHRLHRTFARNKVFSLECWAQAISKYCSTTDPAGIPYHCDERLLCIQKACDRLSKETAEYVLCHANLRANNIRIDPQGRAWLLDWGAATEHSRLIDVADLFAFDTSESGRAAFFEGYGQAFDLRDQMLVDIVIAKLAAGYIWLEQQVRNPTRSQNSTHYIAESQRVLDRLMLYSEKRRE